MCLFFILNESKESFKSLTKGGMEKHVAWVSLRKSVYSYIFVLWDPGIRFAGFLATKGLSILKLKIKLLAPALEVQPDVY